MWVPQRSIHRGHKNTYSPPEQHQNWRHTQGSGEKKKKTILGSSRLDWTSVFCLLKDSVKLEGVLHIWSILFGLKVYKGKDVQIGEENQELRKNILSTGTKWGVKCRWEKLLRSAVILEFDTISARSCRRPPECLRLGKPFPPLHRTHMMLIN